MAETTYIASLQIQLVMELWLQPLVSPDAAGANAITSTDTFVPILLIGMTAADYANFGVGNLVYVA